MKQTYANYYRKYYLKNREKLLEYQRNRRHFLNALKETERVRKIVEDEERIRPSHVLPMRTGSFTTL